MYHYSWFFLIPGMEDGSIFPFLTAGAHSAFVVPTSWTVVLLLVLSALVVRSSLAASAAKGGALQYVPLPGFGLRNVFEVFVGGLLDIFEQVFGSRAKAKQYFPLVGTLFFYVLFSNLIGLVPGMLSPSADMSNNLAMALVVFLVFNAEGIRAHGLVNYLKHYWGPILWVGPFIFFLETLGLFVRPLSMSLRLLGNLSGDHLVLGIFSDLTYLVVPALFVGLGAFVSLIQAFVFSLLSVVYIALAIAHDHDGPHGAEAHDHDHAHAPAGAH